jgi:hypothetical protein
VRRSLVLTIGIALTAVACGGGGVEGGVEAEVWVRSVCTTLTEWNGELQSRTGDLQTEIQGLPRGDFEGLQDVMLTYVDAVIEDTEQAVTSLEDVGVPDVEDGEEASELIVGGIREARTIFVDAREDIAALNPGRPQQFATALQEIGAQVQEGGERVLAGFEAADERGLGGEELDEAFNEEPACSALAG